MHRYAVGLLDKRTGEVRYAEVNGGHIIRMEPRARGTNYGPTGHKTELEETAQARRAQNERYVPLSFSSPRTRVARPFLFLSPSTEALHSALSTHSLQLCA